MFHMVYSPGEIALYQRKLNKKGLGGFFKKFYFLFYIIASVLDLGFMCIC